MVFLMVGLFLKKPTGPVAVAAAMAIAFLFMKTSFEESLLLERYPEYAQYKTRTWGVIPGLR